MGEITFSGNRAAESGQDVLYITERGVFERSGHEDLLELIEVAPGIDIERDIFPNMDFEPIISPNLKVHSCYSFVMCASWLKIRACLSR